MRIRLDRQAQNFGFRTARYEASDASSDGWMRGGYSYTVYTDYELFFENEKEEERGFSYDVRITRNGCDTDVAAEFYRNYTLFAKMLMDRRIHVLSILGCVRVSVSLPLDATIKLRIDGSEVTPAHCDFSTTVPVKELLARLKEDDSEWRRTRLARAIGDYSLYGKDYFVLLDSAPEELFERTLIKLEPVTAGELLKSKLVTAVDIEQALASVAAKAEKGQPWHFFSTDGIEKVILDLPAELRKKALQHSLQSSGNLQMLRDYCPEHIDWSRVKAEEFVDSDLEFVIQSGSGVYSEAEREFIKRCAKKPELSRKAYYCLGAASENIDRTIFLLEIGLLAGVAEEELVQMLLDRQGRLGFELDSFRLREIYGRYNFAPGLAWAKAADDRREAERRRREMEDTEDNERVVRFVQESGKLSVRVRKQHGSSRIESPDGKVIGHLQSSEQRVMLVEGLEYWYLINVERVKKLRNGVLHFDVLDDDARWVIGPKGSHIKETTEKLNECGCELKVIKVHTHTADEV